MAKKSLIVKTQKLQKKLERARAQGKKMPKATRIYRRCKRCGRSRWFMRFFQLCRICFRELATRGELMGIKKSSW